MALHDYLFGYSQQYLLVYEHLYILTPLYGTFIVFLFGSICKMFSRMFLGFYLLLLPVMCLECVKFSKLVFLITSCLIFSPFPFICDSYCSWYFVICHMRPAHGLLASRNTIYHRIKFRSNILT